MFKKTFISGAIWCILLVIGNDAVASLKAGVITQAIAYWKLNGNASDDSANGNDGTIHGDPQPSEDRFGDPAGAYYFDGVGDYIEIGNGVKPTLPLTVSMWVRPDDHSVSMPVFRNDQVNHSGYRYGLQTYVRKAEDASIHTSLYSGYSAPQHRRTYTNDDFEPMDDVWYHLVFVYEDYDNIVAYADIYNSGDCLAPEYSVPEYRTELRPDSLGSGMSYSTGSGTIGHMAGATGDEHSNFFLGSIDDVMVFDRALTPEEVRVIHCIPEPATLLLLGLGGIALVRRRT